MNRLHRVVLLSTAWATCSISISLFGQATPSTTSGEPATVKVYKAGGGVSAPELLPRDFPDMIATDCVKWGTLTIELSMIVDASGIPRNIALLHPAGDDLDQLALRIAESNRFQPGKRDGVPVAVAQSVELKLDGCTIRVADQPGHVTIQFRLSAPPKQKFKPYKKAPSEATLGPGSQPADPSHAAHVASGITAPVPVTHPIAEYSKEARDLAIQGVCMISVIVDAQGMPQNPRVVRPLGHGLDEKAIEAVKQYRFRPAQKNGVPVPVMITIAVNFLL